jgi:hypothetical protein
VSPTARPLPAVSAEEGFLADARKRHAELAADLEEVRVWATVPRCLMHSLGGSCSCACAPQARRHAMLALLLTKSAVLPRPCKSLTRRIHPAPAPRSTQLGKQVRSELSSFLERRAALDRACHDVLAAQERDRDQQLTEAHVDQRIRWVCGCLWVGMCGCVGGWGYWNRLRWGARVCARVCVLHQLQ